MNIVALLVQDSELRRRKNSADCPQKHEIIRSTAANIVDACGPIEIIIQNKYGMIHRYQVDDCFAPQLPPLYCERLAPESRLNVRQTRMSAIGGESGQAPVVCARESMTIWLSAMVNLLQGLVLLAIEPLDLAAAKSSQRQRSVQRLCQTSLDTLQSTPG